MEQNLSAATLRTLLKEAEERETKARDAKREAIKPVMRHTFTPVDAKRWCFDWVNPASQVLVFELVGHYDNKAELLEAGWSEDRTRSGGMRYLVNFAGVAPCIITSAGGGTSFFRMEKQPQVVEELNAFLLENPEGGDVTAIIEPARRASSW